MPSVFTTNSDVLILIQLLVLDPDKRIPLVEVQRHPWVIKHCCRGVKEKSE